MLESVTISTDTESVTLTPEQWDTATLVAPGDGQFIDELGEPIDFLAAEPLQKMAHRLINECPEFSHLANCSIAYLWKRKGGKSGGRAILGKATIASGLLAHLTELNAVIWLAADHIRTAHRTGMQMEAALYHYLSEIDQDVDDDGNATWTRRSPDVQVYIAEVKKYGLWRADLEHLGKAMAQLRLFEKKP